MTRNLLRLHGHRRREHHRILSRNVTRRQKDVLIPQPIRRFDDIAAVFETAPQSSVRNPEILVIVAAQRRKPRHLDGLVCRSNLDGRCARCRSPGHLAFLLGRPRKRKPTFQARFSKPLEPTSAYTRNQVTDPDSITTPEDSPNPNTIRRR